VALLVKGEIQACGTPAEVLDPALLSRVYRVPLQAVDTGTGGPTLIIPGD
jgi:ABC-type cobalamin/Fe3+-siderophores transport system ATPase subunit